MMIMCLKMIYVKAALEVRMINKKLYFFLSFNGKLIVKNKIC